MKTYNTLMKKRDQFNKSWDQMVGVYNPQREQKPYWEDRCLQQLKMAGEYSKHNGEQFKNLIEDTSMYVSTYINNYGYVTEDVCLEVEKKLNEISEHIKKINVHCVSHAHIDMNWLWGYHETVEIVLATMQTMVDLMKEYPDFTFAQSQAAVYKIVEEFDPALLEDIKKYVKEGRWEVTASTWVEHDKNMTGSESFTRQLLYTRSYLCDLLDIEPESITLGFEPDTFGHSVNVPEILSQAGIKYYYHTRGFGGDDYLYKWKSPSGKSLLAYSEPVWYAISIATSAFCHIPMLSSKIGTKDTLFVYGVGDHGGGPTRQDLNRIRMMNSWPLMPNLIFSSYRAFFEAIEDIKETLPVVEGENNLILTGCYTSTSRIKMANSYGENSLISTEISAAMANLVCGHEYDYKRLENSWQKHMFNQFHDILPGCGINFTMEHALGNFQEIIASNNVVKRKALEAISSKIDTSKYEIEVPKGGSAESAGFGVDVRKLIGDMGVSYSTGMSNRGRYNGKTRLFVMYNHTQYTRRDNIEVVLWDYKQNIETVSVCDSHDKRLSFTPDESAFNQYWGHWYTKLSVNVEIQPFGYQVIRVTSDLDGQDKSIIGCDPRVTFHEDYGIESDYLRVVFDPLTMDICSLYSKESKREVLAESGSNFRYVKEEGKDANAWILGQYMSIDDCKKEVTNRKIERNSLYSRVTFDMKVNQSKLTICYTIGNHDKHIHVNIINQWNEIGCEKYTPQLQFKLNLNETCNTYQFDVPMGLIQRPAAVDDDLPGLHFAYANVFSDNNNVYLATDSKYGYRATNDALALNIIRSTTNPNTHAENDTHHTDFIIGTGDVSDAYMQSAFLNCPVETINIPMGQMGDLPLRESFMEIDSQSTIVTSIKKAQTDNALVIKMYQSSDLNEEVTLKFVKSVSKAFITDVLENSISEITNINGNQLTQTSKASSMTIIKVYFD